jgi:predicted Zn-ribbon and HTH transcriptional regulator
MDQVVFGDYTIQDILIIAAIFVGVVVLISLLKKVFSKSTGGGHTQSARCPNCGWQGNVSRFAGRCPKCNKPLGERKADSSQ